MAYVNGIAFIRTGRHWSMVLRSYGLEDIVSGVRKCVVLPVEPKEEEKTLYAAWQKDDAKAASLLANVLYYRLNRKKKKRYCTRHGRKMTRKQQVY
ncbi:hypothetical protein QE152_g29198 [Popillia japonica]|uniref:Uncharacterized protein n=1 Tax=Popillia japonica TaxID=7064 RepID=A0AAW1JIM1_POPJA